MRTILVSSVEEYSGKTGIIAALGLILKERGLNVGYFKPFGVESVKLEKRAGCFGKEGESEEGIEGGGEKAAEAEEAGEASGASGASEAVVKEAEEARAEAEEAVDEDAFRIAKILNLEESPAEICPVLLDRPYEEFLLLFREADAVNALKKKVQEAFKRVSAGKDVVLVEGVANYRVGKSVELCDFNISAMLNAEILMIAKYKNFVLDDILYAKEHSSSSFKVIFNQVPRYKMAYMDFVSSFLEERGVEVVGAIPQDDALAALSVGEICEAVGGRLIGRPSDEGILVEELLVGAMTPQSAITYFRRSRNAAVITGGDRSDLQALALEIPAIKCLVLTGGLEPPTIIKGAAVQRGKPLILAPDDTLTVVERLNKAFGKARLHSEAKIRRMRELLLKHVNIENILS